MSLIRGCQFPDELYFDQDLNLWLKPLGPKSWQVGITEFGGALVGDIYMFNPKPIGREFETGDAFALIEVAKTIITVKAPFPCLLTCANEEIQERPIRINKKPYESWLVHLEPLDLEGAKRQLLYGMPVILRAQELMDLNRFTSLEEFKAHGGGQ